MSEYRHPLYFKGAYQVVAVVSGREYDPNQIIGYEVLSMSGAKIRHETSLDSARGWMDRLADEEVVAQQPGRPEVKRPRKRAAKRVGKSGGKRGLLKSLLLRR